MRNAIGIAAAMMVGLASIYANEPFEEHCKQAGEAYARQDWESGDEHFRMAGHYWGLVNLRPRD